ncbi:MAG: FGGY-family carbohydrate kinase [Desulfotignum sp.]|nr:FGGY-family carbohydrate kinase [Desulfotignum sp.]
MTDRHILAIDCGTQSLRAMVFSAGGDMLARAKKVYPPYVSPGPGRAEQDPEIYWSSLKAACMELKHTAPQVFENIAGMGVTTLRNTLVNLDRQGRVLRPAITWMDQRRAGPVSNGAGFLALGFFIPVLGKKLKDIQAQGKCNWIMQHQGDIWDNTHKYVQVSGFLHHRLTGEFADALACQIGHLPFDYKHHCWARGPCLVKTLFPVPETKLPRLVPAGEIIGTVSRAASDATGIAAGMPVIACGSDKGCETLGAGVMGRHMVNLSFGTTATVQTMSDRYFETLPLMPPYPAPMPGYYNPEVEIFRGFWMISWFKDQFAHKEVAEAQALGVPPEQILDRCLKQTSPGAMGLMVQPYWGPGLDYPGAKGAMIGFGDVHTKKHVYRAVIEGLGFALLAGMEKIEKKSRIRVEKAVVSGGASQSDQICKIAADIFNLPMARGRTHETSGLGAAIVTAKGLGIYPDIAAAAGHMIQVKTVFDPDPASAALYRQLYSRVYRKMYPALAPLYAQIRKITKYPG